MGDNRDIPDARGAPRGDPNKPAKRKREGTPYEGMVGNLPHERCEEAAILIREMASYGMPQEEICYALNAARGGGFSVETLTRHYRHEIDVAMAERKGKLLARAHKIAMGEDVPPGVSPDEAYRTSSRQLNWLLGAVHRVRNGVEHDFGAGTINVTISDDDEKL